LKLSTKQLAVLLKFGEEVTLEDIQELIFNKSVILKNAQKNGETTKINRVAGEIEQC
jgi:hypothetical protein